MTTVNRTQGTQATNNAQGSAPVNKGTMKGGSMYWATSPLPSMAGSVAGLQSTASAPASSSARPPLQFTTSTGSDLLGAYGGNFMELADRAEIGGGKDRETFGRAMNSLQSAAAKPVMAEKGQQPGQAQLALTAEQIAAIKSAPTPEAAKLEVLKAISQQTGIPLDQLDPTGAGKKGNRPAREALNALLGTQIKDGREKNAGSAIMLDAICDSVAKSVRGTDIPAPAPTHLGPAGSNRMRGQGSEFDMGPPPPVDGKPAQGEPTTPGAQVIVDLGDYVQPAGEVRELQSPLIFDLAGVGLKIKQGDLIDVDLDGDGKKEVITDLDKGIGLLVFDSQCKVRGDSAAGRDYFGDKTDMSAYGIVSRNLDKKWNNGFDALRALCEHYDLVRPGKQYLDANDLQLLEREVGLRMRIDGVRGADKTFAELGITRINLGDPGKIQSMRDAQSDAFGNKLMKQAGANFIVKGKTRDYADLWFNVQARATTSKSVKTGANAAPLKASALGAGFARRM